jgi:serine/threonine protein kinase
VQYYGSYSLHQWLLCHDWLPNLEARLALDEEAARRVGDDRTGGPEVSRQLRLLRVIMRDLLIGLNYVHSRGLAHTELRLQNVHISAADRHVKTFLAMILGKLWCLQAVTPRVQSHGD